MRKVLVLLSFALLGLCAPAAAHAYVEPTLLGPPAPAWIGNARLFEPSEDKPLIAIVIDDMGVDSHRSKRAAALPAEVTLAYLPYARNVKEQAAASAAAGHEILVHLPMEPLRASANPGPDFLDVKAAPDELRALIEKNLSAFEGYVGINNHMGSKFTSHAASMAVVMEELARRGLLYLDLKTVKDSVGEQTALEHGLASTHRDVFLDDEETEAFTENALEKVEHLARRHGSVVAIGHPKNITLKDLEAWLPTLEAKGFQLAPLTAVVRHRMGLDSARRMASFEPDAGAVEYFMGMD